MITFEEILAVDAQGKATVTLPPSVKPGLHRAVLHIEDATEVTTAKPAAPKAGCLKGFRMAQDFDAPLEDLREYLE